MSLAQYVCAVYKWNWAWKRHCRTLPQATDFCIALTPCGSTEHRHWGTCAHVMQPHHLLQHWRQEIGAKFAASGSAVYHHYHTLGSWLMRPQPDSGALLHSGRIHDTVISDKAPLAKLVHPQRRRLPIDACNALLFRTGLTTLRYAFNATFMK